MNTKTCSTCKQEKDTSLFGKNKYSKDSLTSNCLECKNKASREWDKRNKERKSTSNREWYHRVKAEQPNKFPKQRREAKFKRVYGITTLEYDEMLQAQDFKCVTCGKEHVDSEKEKLRVDHCHTTQKVRGLLCHHCNVTLGLIKENIEVLEALKSYVLKHQSN
jgi:hypothetical protein